jgi:hypothetical protein
MLQRPRMYFPTVGAGRQGANPATFLLYGVVATGGPGAPGVDREPCDGMGEGMPA